MATSPKKATGPITDAERRRVKQLHGKGLPRNEIARVLGRSYGAVSKVARDLGLTFDRAAQVQAATAVRTADLSARRTAFAARLQDIAEREADKLTAPTVYWDWGGKEHDYDQREQPEPHAADRRSIMATIATAVDRSLKLVPPKEDGGQESRSVIGDLMAGLARDYVARHGQAPPEPDEGTPDSEPADA
ncbi:helix-turn-helix domain-containing protein [Streptomyces sp. LE64]|uniref:helix-turn-helix domain-containing protein n=1 Tax=Streptomyces sp. LE64 TaxID=3448653 RepID=UPI004041A26D